MRYEKQGMNMQIQFLYWYARIVYVKNRYLLLLLNIYSLYVDFIFNWLWDNENATELEMHSHILLWEIAHLFCLLVTHHIMYFIYF